VRTGPSLNLCLAVAATLATIAAAENETQVGQASARGLLFHPDGPGQYRFRLGVGAAMDVLPLKVVQSETRQLPQVAAYLRFGLPYEFSVDLRVSAIVITNQVEIGAAWATHWGPVALTIFDHHGINYGFVGVQGFDASSWGWVNKPGFGLGFDKGSVHFTVTFELIYTLAQHTRLGDLTRVSNYSAGFEGTAVGVTVETVLRSQAILYYGLALLRTAPNYELWLAFSDQRARLLHPRFIAGYAF
jgi:hypothetical protein